MAPLDSLIAASPLATRMLLDLPEILTEDPDVRAVIYAQAREKERLDDVIETIRLNLQPLTADSDGLALWETILRLAVYPRGPVGAVNLSTNPSFEYGIGTATDDFAGGTFTLNTAWFLSGKQSLRYVIPGGCDRVDLTGQTVIGGGAPVTPGTTYTASLVLNNASSGTQLSGPSGIEIAWWDGSRVMVGSPVTGTAINWVTSQGVQRMTATGVAPVGAVSATVRLVAFVTLMDISVDEVMFVAGTTAPDYFDGDQENCRWEGTPGASASDRIDIVPLEDRRDVVMAYYLAASVEQTGLSWEQSVLSIAGAGSTYSEHQPGVAVPPAYNVALSLAFPPTSDAYDRIRNLVERISPANLVITASSADGFYLDGDELDEGALG